MTTPADDEILIRPAGDADARPLAAFIHPFVEDKKLLPRTEAELEWLVTQGFIAVQHGEIVGFAALEIYSPKLAEVRSLAVSETVRGKGVGKRLVEACVNRARDRQVLEVMAISSAEDFFRSCGFNFTLPDEKKAFFLQTRDV